MVFYNESEGKKRYGTVIASLGIDPKKMTEKYMESLTKEFGCVFERGELTLVGSRDGRESRASL